jgi:hypothetical protein
MELKVDLPAEVVKSLKTRAKKKKGQEATPLETLITHAIMMESFFFEVSKSGGSLLIGEPDGTVKQIVFDFWTGTNKDDLKRLRKDKPRNVNRYL